MRIGHCGGHGLLFVALLAAVLFDALFQAVFLLLAGALDFQTVLVPVLHDVLLLVELRPQMQNGPKSPSCAFEAVSSLPKEGIQNLESIF